MATGRQLVSQEEIDNINNPNYLYTCTTCNKIKPNSEYVIDRKRTSIRKYTSSCKVCRNEYGKSEKVKSRKRERSPILRKKDRISLIYWSSVANARKRELEHSITKDYINKLYEDQKGLCFYTNKPMLKNTILEQDNDDSVSIDRFDSSKGYIEGNIVLCRWVINRMKNDIQFNKFLELISDIHKNHNIKNGNC